MDIQKADFLNCLNNIQIVNHDSEIDAWEAEQAQKRKQKAYEQSGVPKRYFQSDFSTFVAKSDEQKKMLQMVKKFAANVKKGKCCTLFLIGNAGTGKTHLACSALREIGGIYKESADVVDSVKAAGAFGAGTTPERVIKQLARERFLVIDEIGRGNSKDEASVLFRLYNTIYNEETSSIWIGNFKNKEALLDFVGAAFIDRLNESGAVFEAKGDSYRKVLRDL